MNLADWMWRWGEACDFEWWREVLLVTRPVEVTNQKLCISHFKFMPQCTLLSAAQIVLYISVPADLSLPALRVQRDFAIVSMVEQPNFRARVAETGSKIEEKEFVPHWCIGRN